MTRTEKLENILRNLRDLHKRSQTLDENQFGEGAESMMTQLIDLVADVVEEIQEPVITVDDLKL